MTDSSPGGPTTLRCVHYLDAIREESGGVVRAVLDLVGALARAGVEVTLLTADAKDAPAAWLDGGAGCPRVMTIGRAMTPWMAVAAADRGAIDQSLASADVVHLHTPWDPYNVAFASACQRAGVPYVVSIHGMLDDWCIAHRGMKKRAFLAIAGRRMLEGAAAIHFTADEERRQAMKWAPRGEACVLPLVMDLSPYRDLPGPEPARSAFPPLREPGAKLLFLSRVHPKKGVELLVDAAAAMHARGDAVTVLIAGPGEPAYIEQLAGRARAGGVADRVHFLGMVRGREKLSLYQASDLFVLPTSQENFGIVLTEAMTCGTPTVTTRGVDIWRELEQRGAVIVEKDAGAIVEAIDRLRGEGPALADRGRGSRDAVFEWLDPETLIADYIGFYQAAANPS